MTEINQLLKDLMTFDERRAKYDAKIEFQLKTEIDVDEEIEKGKIRVAEMEEK